MLKSPRRITTARRFCVRPHPHERWEAGDATIGEFLIAVSDQAADGRRVSPLVVGKAGADREGQPAGKFHHDRAHAACVTATARDVFDHSALGVTEGFHLQQRGRPSRLVLRTGLPEHQPLATQGLDAGQFELQVLDARATYLVEHRGVGRAMLPDQVEQGLLPFLESATRDGSVEQHVLDLSPVFALVVATNNAHGPLECLAVEPKLAVQGHVRQSGGEPVGGMINVTLTGKEPAAVPPGPHAVELFAHPPAGKVRGVVPRVGQKQLGHSGRDCRSRGGRKRGRRAEPLPLQLLTPVGPRCLQLLRSIGKDWFLQAGHVQE